MLMSRKKKTPGVIKYPKTQKSDKSQSLEAALKRILTLGGRASNLTIAAAPHPRRKEVVKNFLFWKSQNRQRSPYIFSLQVPANDNGDQLNRERRIEDTPDIRSANVINPSADVRESSDSRIEEQDRTPPPSQEETVDLSMESRDSIIWRNVNSMEQVMTESDKSNVSLAVNPPSSMSNQDDSASDDSQATKSSHLNLDDERRWLRYKVENLTRDECIIVCVIGQMILSADEMSGSREMIPTDEESRQSLLSLCYGGCWELNNLRTVLDLSEFLPVGLRKLTGLGIRGRDENSRKILETKLEACLELGRKLNQQNADSN